MKFRRLSRNEEKRVLAAMLCQLDGELPNSFGARFKRELYMLGIGVFAALLSLVTFTDPEWYISSLAIGWLLTGIAMGIIFCRHSAMAQWPAVARCIDRSAIELRLRELDA